jgi:hypothetical protein
MRAEVGFTPKWYRHYRGLDFGVLRYGSMRDRRSLGISEVNYLDPDTEVT